MVKVRRMQGTHSAELTGACGELHLRKNNPSGLCKEDQSRAWGISKEAPVIVQVRAERVSCRWRAGEDS